MISILKWSNLFLLKNRKYKLKEEFKISPIVISAAKVTIIFCNTQINCGFILKSVEQVPYQQTLLLY